MLKLVKVKKLRAQPLQNRGLVRVSEDIFEGWIARINQRFHQPKHLLTLTDFALLRVHVVDNIEGQTTEDSDTVLLAFKVCFQNLGKLVFVILLINSLRRLTFQELRLFGRLQ